MPKKKKPVEQVSEHGQHGGYTPGDTGATPTAGETGTATQDGTGYGTNGDGVTVADDKTDYSTLLNSYSLPPEVANEINRIYHSSLKADGTINYEEAYNRAHAFVLGTAWYAATYPNIQQGINAGLFKDESSYRSYQNDVNQVYRQYFNRDATVAEVASHIATGKEVGRVAAEFKSQAIRGNFSDPLNSVFGADELAALADQQAGIDTSLGQKVAAEADLFTKLSPLYQNFYGRSVTRADLDQLTASGTSAQQVAQSFAVESNINGMNPAVRDLFTPEEIRQVALDSAGGITPKGQSLKALMDLSLQLNPVYHQYTNAGVSRADVENAYGTGLSAATVSKQFAGKAYVDANRGDIQQASGAFGDTGQLSDAQLKAYGEEQAGLDTPLGQAATAAYQKALDRLHGVFKGVLASPALSLQSGRLAGPGATKPPDIGA